METYPTNSTAVHRPVDAGIIAAVKLQYKNRLLIVRVSAMFVVSQLRGKAKERKPVAGEVELHEGHHAQLLDACELLAAAWDR